MSPSERRHATRGRIDPRLLVLAAFLLGALLTAGAAVVLSGTSGDSPSGRAEVVDSSGPTSTARDGAASSASGQASPSPFTTDQNEQHALMTKPLAQLARGDRVVYNMKACRFHTWVGQGQDVALIACAGGAPFQVRTEYLVPVEPGGD